MQTKMPLKIMSYIPFLFLISLFADGKDIPSVRFHCGQGMLVTIIFVIKVLFDRIPFIGEAISLAVMAATVVYMVIGIMNVANDRDDELPFIGKYAFYK